MQKISFVYFETKNIVASTIFLGLLQLIVKTRIQVSFSKQKTALITNTPTPHSQTQAWVNQKNNICLLSIKTTNCIPTHRPTLKKAGSLRNTV